MKKFLFSIILSIILFCSSSLSYASNEVNPLFVDSLNNYFNNSESIIFDENGANVTNMYHEYLTDLYKSNKYIEAEDFVVNNNLVLSWLANLPSPRTSLLKTVYRDFSVTKNSITNSRLRCSWTVRLTGKLYYEQNRKYITSVNSPTLSILTVNFDGYSMTPSLSNVSTKGTKKDKYHATFSASYNFLVHVTETVGNVNKGTYTFPRISINFDASV